MREYDGFQIEDLGDGIYWIKEATGLHMYLVIGRERSALIDTGVGVGDLKGCIASITDKPTVVCITHYHHDHAGGAGNFEEVYISSKDAPRIADGTDRAARESFLSVLVSEGVLPAQVKEKLISGTAVKCNKINPGDVIDLGGRRLEVVCMAGHTPGSVGYFDDLTGTLFAGDGCNNSTFLFSEDCLDISEYKANLLRLKADLGERLKRMVIFHDFIFVPLKCIDNVLECCDIILNNMSEEGYFETPLMKGPETYARWAKLGGPNREDGEFGNIVYDTRRVR